MALLTPRTADSRARSAGSSASAADDAGVLLGDLRQAGEGEVRVGGLREGGKRRMALGW